MTPIDDNGDKWRSRSGWTVDTVKEYLDSRIDGNDKRYDQRFQAQESATAYAQEKANEFRGSLDDVNKKQMPRTEAEALMRALGEKMESLAKGNADKIDLLDKRLDRNEGRGAGLSAGWGYLIGAIGLISAVIAIVYALRR